MSADLDFRPDTYWPDGDNSEPAEVAGITVESHLGDTMYVLAEMRDDGTMGFRVTDDERSDLTEVNREPATRPLSLGELFELIDTVDMGVGTGMVQGTLELNEMVGSGNPDHTAFLTVWSEFYPGITEHYAGVIDSLVMSESKS
jgi:hypothetical protein